jgi:hypothetical protein
MTPLEAALTAMDLLEPREQFSYKQMSRDHGCSRAALVQRHQGVSISYATCGANQRALHPHQEQELLHYIECPTSRGLLPTRAMIRNVASQIAKRELGVHWINCFVQRYPDKLMSKWTKGKDNSRHKANSGWEYSFYFDLLREKIEQFCVEPHHIQYR